MREQGFGTKPEGMRVAVEDVDLKELAATLRARFAGAGPVGYLDGRTVLRDAVVEELECSELEAEEMVDTLVAGGFARYDGDPTAAGDEGRGWSLGA